MISPRCVDTPRTAAHPGSHPTGSSAHGPIGILSQTEAVRDRHTLLQALQARAEPLFVWACRRTVLVCAWPCSGLWRVAMTSADCVTSGHALGPLARNTTQTIWAPCAYARVRRWDRRAPALRACLQRRVGKYVSGSSGDSSEDDAALLRSCQACTTLALLQKFHSHHASLTSSRLLPPFFFF